jgi:hypothetical protein
MRLTLIGLAGAALVLGGCSGKLDITNPNSPTAEGAATNPREASSRLVVGVIAAYRNSMGGAINAMGSYGRETYNMTPQDGRNITGPFRDWAQNNAFTAGQNWGRYTNYRNAFEAIQVIEGLSILTEPEKHGAVGLLKTFIAFDMLDNLHARGAIGIVVDMVDDATVINAIVSQDSAYKWISAKLDEAKADLDQAGGSFYFPMHLGFSAFGVAANTPAGFAQLNRAIKARVEVERGSLGCGATCYTAALTALSGTWISGLTTTNRDAGVYVIYSTALGDALNGTSFAQNTDLYVHPLIDNIPGVGADDRYRRKVDQREAAASNDDACSGSYSDRTLVTVTAKWRPCTYATNVTPIPIIRHEELILLRAEARWNTGDQNGARSDLASIRTVSGSDRGGTSAVAFANPATATEFTSELLLQRTLSLFQEAKRFVAYRRLGRLAELGTLPQDIAAGFTVAPYIVLPLQECSNRERVGNPGGIPRTCPGGAP